MNCVALVLVCAGLAAATTSDGVFSTINIYGHGYKTIGNDHFFRFGGSDVPDPLVSSIHDSLRTHPFVNPYFVSPSGKFFRRFIVRDLFETPLVLLVKSPDKEGQLMHVFAEKGLRTIFSDSTFKPIADYFKSPVEKSGIIYDTKTFYNTRLFDVPISRMIVPKDFKVGDMIKFLVDANEIPVVVIMDKVDLENVRIDALTDVAKLGVSDTTIEPIVEPITPVILKTLH